MFRRWPFFQRLLSWTKPYAPVAARHAALRALRLEQPDPGDRRASGGDGRPDGRDLLLPEPAGDAGRPRGVRRPAPGCAVRFGCRWTGDPPARRRPVRARDERREYTAGTLVFAVGVSEPWRPTQPGHGARRALRRHPPGRAVRRPADLHHRQAELGLRAGQRDAALGEADRDRLAIARQAVGQHPFPRRDPGTLRPAVRGPRARRRRRRSSTRRSSGSSAARPAARHSGW